MNERTNGQTHERRNEQTKEQERKSSAQRTKPTQNQAKTNRDGASDAPKAWFLLCGSQTGARKSLRYAPGRSGAFLGRPRDGQRNAREAKIDPTTVPKSLQSRSDTPPEHSGTPRSVRKERPGAHRTTFWNALFGLAFPGSSQSDFRSICVRTGHAGPARNITASGVSCTSSVSRPNGRRTTKTVGNTPFGRPKATQIEPDRSPKSLRPPPSDPGRAQFGAGRAICFKAVRARGGGAQKER